MQARNANTGYQRSTEPTTRDRHTEKPARHTQARSHTRNLVTSRSDKKTQETVFVIVVIVVVVVVVVVGGGGGGVGGVVAFVVVFVAGAVVVTVAVVVVAVSATSLAATSRRSRRFAALHKRMSFYGGTSFMESMILSY